MDYTAKFISLHQSLMALTHDEGFLNRDRQTKLRAITRTCCERLNVSRVSVWGLNECADTITCELMYLAESDTFKDGLELREADGPKYFQAIKENRIVDAHSAQTDPRTAEFSLSYLQPLGIRSLLDTPIFAAGRLQGVLCLEHIGPERRWDIAELAYAAALADTISLINQHESWMREHQKMEFLEHFDSLTGLENRRSFLQRIERDPERENLPQASRALLLMGLDHFSQVNDRHGQHLADKALCDLAYRLRVIAQTCGASLARSGDEFLFWLPQAETVKQLEKIITQLMAELAEPVTVAQGTDIPLQASTGVVVYPQLGEAIRDPIHCAELALRRAKRQQRGSIEYFSNAWLDQLQVRREEEQALRTAFEEQQLCAYYQPILGQAGLPTCAEALVRWQHPEKGILPPGAFLPLLAELGLMGQLGDFMLRQACSDLHMMRQQGHAPAWVSVNISAEQLYSGQLVQQVSGLLQEFELPGECLQLEIVEELIGQESDLLRSQLLAFSELGVGLAIDDFGTGYSSLSRLKLLPVNKLKIDKSFVDGLPGDPHDQCIARSIIGLARGMDMQVVAEGVETASQADWLRQQGCEYLQGYCFAKPMPLADLQVFMSS